MPEVGLRIRLEDDLRREFIATCKSKDSTAAQVLRSFMRTYIEQNSDEYRQGKLFAEVGNNPTTGKKAVANAR